MPGVSASAAGSGDGQPSGLHLNYTLAMTMYLTPPAARLLPTCLCRVTHHTASLRMQSDPANKDFQGISPERAYADYVLAAMVLFAAAWNYIG